MNDARIQIDAKAVAFLRAVEHYGGKANTTQIRHRTGLNRDETNYRFNRLEKLGLIEISREEHGYGDREPPKIAHLTGKARREIERGLFAGHGFMLSDDPNVEEVSFERFRQFEDRLERIDRKVDTALWSGADPDTEFVRYSEFEQLENFVFNWTETAEAYLVSIREFLESRFDFEISDDPESR